MNNHIFGEGYTYNCELISLDQHLDNSLCSVLSIVLKTPSILNNWVIPHFNNIKIFALEINEIATLIWLLKNNLFTYLGITAWKLNIKMRLAGLS